MYPTSTDLEAAIRSLGSTQEQVIRTLEQHGLKGESGNPHGCIMAVYFRWRFNLKADAAHVPGTLVYVVGDATCYPRPAGFNVPPSATFPEHVCRVVNDFDQLKIPSLLGTPTLPSYTWEEWMAQHPEPVSA